VAATFDAYLHAGADDEQPVHSESV
jgi:hypothetical protein